MSAIVNFSDNLPLELFPIIFSYLPYELDNIALVCQKWRIATNSQWLRDQIRPSGIMGIDELKKLNPKIIDAGKETLLPRSVYSKMKGWLVFNPIVIKVKNDEGKIEEIALTTIKAWADLFKIEFTDITWEPAFKEESKEKAPHWGWIDTNTLGFEQTFAQQQTTVKKEDEKAYSNSSRQKQIVQMVNAYDLTQGMLMAKALNMECPFVWDMANSEYRIIRTNTITKDEDALEQPIILSMAPSGLAVDCNGEASECVATLCERISYGY